MDATKITSIGIFLIIYACNLLNLKGSVAIAGEAGRGFSIVAQEMRKLSQINAESSKKSTQKLLEMKNSVKDIAKEINNTNLIAESQAASTEEITATLEEITASLKC